MDLILPGPAKINTVDNSHLESAVSILDTPNYYG